jgi:hypothetical protein
VAKAATTLHVPCPLFSACNVRAIARCNVRSFMFEEMRVDVVLLVASPFRSELYVYTGAGPYEILILVVLALMSCTSLEGSSDIRTSL